MSFNKRCINHLRTLSCEMITNANSGHPGVALGAATIMYALFKDHYFYDVKDNNFIARDRLVLSCGHASALYYATAYMFNFGIHENDLKSFRQIDSKTPGHPEYGVTNFVEVSTGPLGQGIANAVGLAIGQSIIGNKFNAQKYPVVDNYTYYVCGDGCLMEGVGQEALSLAGTLKLNKLILLYDYNNITIDGAADMANAENPAKKFKAMNWNVITVNGNNYYKVTRAISKAKKSATKPTVIICKTIIGYGAENQGKNSIHGKPLTVSELSDLKNKFEIETSFNLPQDVKEYVSKTNDRVNSQIEKWNNMFALYQKTNPDLYKQLTAFMDNKKIDSEKLLKDDVLMEELAGRDANALILKELANKMPRFIGGTADLAPSVKAYINGAGDYSAKNRNGKNIHYGVREHAMGAICNGLTLYLKCPSFCSTFMAFSNYMIPPIRMSALMDIPSWFMFTHDSYKVGEDGPTHQSIDQLGALRLIPNLNVYRPCDTKELVACYDLALRNNNPSAFILTKQKLKPQNSEYKDILKGGYILNGKKGDVIIYASGSEVELANNVKSVLESQDIKVVVASFPCLEVFDKQPEKYKQEILNKGKLKVSLEASNDNIWYKYIGEKGLKISIEEFGKSAKSKNLDDFYKFQAKDIAKRIKSKLKKGE